MISLEYKNWAQQLATLCTDQPSVVRHFDESKQSHIDIFTASFRPNIQLHATIGLMEFNQAENLPEELRHEESVDQPEIYTEILLVSDASQERAANILATIAMHIIKQGWKVRPNVCFKRMVELEYPNGTTQHCYFVTPNIINPDLEKLNLTTKVLQPLIALPISDAEFEFWQSNQQNAVKLMERFDQAKPAISNFNRDSLI